MPDESTKPPAARTDATAPTTSHRSFFEDCGAAVSEGVSCVGAGSGTSIAAGGEAGSALVSSGDGAGGDWDSASSAGGGGGGSVTAGGSTAGFGRLEFSG